MPTASHPIVRCPMRISGGNPQAVDSGPGPFVVIAGSRRHPARDYEPARDANEGASDDRQRTCGQPHPVQVSLIRVWLGAERISSVIMDVPTFLDRVSDSDLAF